LASSSVLGGIAVRGSNTAPPRFAWEAENSDRPDIAAFPSTAGSPAVRRGSTGARAILARTSTQAARVAKNFRHRLLKMEEEVAADASVASASPPQHGPTACLTGAAWRSFADFEKLKSLQDRR
jgi:hypothetical protein